MKNTKKKLSVSLVVLGLSLLGGYKANAAEVLTGNTDLKGYDATITTKADGTNVLKTKKGEYDLNETSTIYSSKTITVTLNNTTPANINKIQAKKTLELRGNGQLNVNTTEDVGITVGDHFKAFKHAKYGKGSVTANANKIGLRVHNEIQMEGGSVEATGAEYGIYCENDIKPYYDSVLKGTSSDGIGIHAYRDIYAWKGATVVGEGKISGARSIIAHIQAEDEGSSITGISTDINSSLSALHADKRMLRAYRGAVVREEYKNPPFVITDNIPIFVTEYASISRNMQYTSNYNWISEPESVYLNDQGGLLGDLSKGTPKEVTITATRAGVKCQKNKFEKTELKNNGQHIITFSNTATKFVRPVIINYWNYDTSVEGSYKLIEKQTIEMDIGSTFVVNDHLYKFNPTAEYDLIEVDTSDFEITKDSNEYTVNYYYDAEFNK
ncbi:hypothetical protein ACYSNW_11135 [Enterococcus sp. LJL99]